MDSVYNVHPSHVRHTHHFCPIKQEGRVAEAAALAAGSGSGAAGGAADDLEEDDDDDMVSVRCGVVLWCGGGKGRFLCLCGYVHGSCVYPLIK